MNKSTNRIGAVKAGRKFRAFNYRRASGVIHPDDSTRRHVLPLFAAYVRLSRNYFLSRQKYLEPVID
jgi:hypothetical protein